MAKIMVVDDVKAMREMLNAALKSMKHDVTVCSSCAEATTALNSSGPYELLFLDISLDDGDGITIMKLVKHMNEKNRTNTKVCFISGSRDRDTVMRAIIAGGDDYIVKPLEPKVFKEKVASLLGSSVQNPHLELEANLKANLFESPIAIDLRVTKISTKAFVMHSNLEFERGKVLDVVVPTLGNLVGYKGTFRGQVATVEKVKNGQFKVTLQLHAFVPQTLEDRINSLCLKGQKLLESDEAEKVQAQNAKNPPKKAASQPKASPMSSMALAALGAFGKK